MYVWNVPFAWPYARGTAECGKAFVDPTTEGRRNKCVCGTPPSGGCTSQRGECRQVFVAPPTEEGGDA